MESFRISFRITRVIENFYKHSTHYKSSLRGSSGVLLNGTLYPYNDEILTIDDDWVISSDREKVIGKNWLVENTFSFYEGLLPQDWREYWNGGGLRGDEAIGGFNKLDRGCVVSLALSDAELERIRRVLTERTYSPIVFLSVGVSEAESYAAQVDRSVRSRDGVYLAPIYSFEMSAEIPTPMD